MVGVHIPPTSSSGMDGLRLSASPAHIRGPAALRLPLLTLGSLGTQIVWSVEMAYGTPYLLELGLSKSAMAAVYTAGPISGLVVQPLIGVLTDRSTHRWGRRRPYLVASCLLCSLFVLLLGYARILANLFQLPSAILPLTVLAIWGLDFSVNAVMTLNRALIFDILSADQQPDGNAWLARLCGIGSILGFFVGDLDLPATAPFSMLPTLGVQSGMTPSEPQIRCLSLLTVTFILSTHAVVVWAAVEQRLETIPGYRRRDILGPQSRDLDAIRIVTRTASEFSRTARTLSTPIRDVLRIQIFSWICWFPLMFYSTEWISSVAVESYLTGLTGEVQSQRPDMKKLKAQGTRAGSHAMFLQALVSFTCSLILPFLLPSPGVGLGDSVSSGLPHALPPLTSSAVGGRRAYAAPRWLPPFLQELFEMLINRKSAQSNAEGPLWSWTRGGIKLTTLWTVAHFAVALITWFTWPVAASKSVGMATLLIAMAGYSWSVTNWGPYSLLGILIQSGLAAREERAAGTYQSVLMSDTSSGSRSREEGEQAAEGEGEDPRFARSEQEEEAEQASLFFDPTATLSPTAGGPERETESHQAGTILGIHNTAIVLPQLFVSLLASLIFALYETGSSSTWDEGVGTQSSQGDALGLVFRLGGIASVIAGFYTIKLAKEWGDVIGGATRSTLGVGGRGL